MKETQELINFYKNNHKDDLVLCTIVKKQGSSYRSLFAKKIINLITNESCGLLTGGCLEGELERYVRSSYTQLPKIEIFNTTSEDDRLLGWQKGCSGIIEVLFERLPQDISELSLFFPFGKPQIAAGVQIQLNSAQLGKRKWSDTVDSNENCLFEKWQRPIELVIVGCGADADPYVDLSQTLGWSTRFVDYRSDLARHNRFSNNYLPELIALDKIADSIGESEKAAVVLMTHNFEADLKIFSDLIGKNVGYLGCLGPKKRFDLIKKDLKTFYQLDVPLDWEKKVVKAPPGITSSNHNPTEIAFSIVADIQARLAGNV